MMTHTNAPMLSRKGVMLTWRTLVRTGLCLLACAAAFVGVRAQQRNAGIKPLTAEDKEEMRELQHRYSFALENCPESNSGYDYADLFTEDGQFGLGTNNKGRENLARISGRRPDGSCEPNRYRGPATKIHLNVGEIFMASPEGARGVVNLIMVDGPGGTPYWDGWYEDTFARTPKGWRFKQRVHVWQSRAGTPPEAAQRHIDQAAVTMAMKADPNIPVSRNPVKWVDGFDNRALQDTPAYAPGVGGTGGRQGGGRAGGGQQGGGRQGRQ